ncbi:predicted protein [Brucella melitensis bv. 1 str. Rev.1]|nr:predicted protein [Brucella melitensis bv. 1 str. Rev.1]
MVFFCASGIFIPSPTSHSALENHHSCGSFALFCSDIEVKASINNQRSASTLIWIVTAIGFGNFNEDFVALAGPKMLFGGDAKDRWRGEAPIQGKKLNRCDSGLVDIKSGYLRRSDMVPRFARDNCF